VLELTALPRLPEAVGERTVYRHAGLAFFITPTSGCTWVVGRDGSGATIALLERADTGPRRFTLNGPGVATEGESWMLLLAEL